MGIVEDYIKEAIIASREKELLEAYDKEWVLKDEAKREGIKEGKLSGFEDGKLAQKKEIVIVMLKEKLDVNLISRITGLSTQEINAIKNNS